MLGGDEEDGVEPTQMGRAVPGGLQLQTVKILYDEDASIDEPTHDQALILVTGIGKTDCGNRRRRNEDRLLVLEDEGLFVVADGMGGYRGGERASDLAVRTLETAFQNQRFVGTPGNLPKRAAELASAVQMANDAIFAEAGRDRALEGMGTTISAARFSRNKQRLYIAHVGDSRVYLLRDGVLKQMTVDHTMQQLGVKGDAAGHLSRAVGIWPTTPIDIVLGKPLPGDVYLLCSDGLTKMVDDATIQSALCDTEPSEIAERLVAAAKERGGRDNVTVIVVRVDEPVAAAA